jgi:rare lipoprotein A (peptidoglycan hydrolase)
MLLLNKIATSFNVIMPVLLLVLLAACSGHNSKPDVHNRSISEQKQVADAPITQVSKDEDVYIFSSPPKANPHPKIGRSYRIAGVRYTPKVEPNYTQVGVASWYGKQFHNKLTANGEVFDMFEVSAAHRTLPLPSVVKVENLRNGKSIIARVNDRGPFKDNRIIDMSYAAASQLDFINQGLTKVKVTLLKDESNKAWRKLANKNLYSTNRRYTKNSTAKRRYYE